MNYFAEQLKNLRIQHGLAMQALAVKANVSKSMICKIERGVVQPTLDVAGRLANALNKPLSEMLHAKQASKIVHLSKKQQAIWKDAQQIKRRNISPIFEGLKLEWLYVELPPGAAVKGLPAAKNGAEKYILVLKGMFEAKIGEEIFKLKAGDCLYFEANQSHSFLNPGKVKTEYQIVIKHE